MFNLAEEFVRSCGSCFGSIGSKSHRRSRWYFIPHLPHQLSPRQSHQRSWWFVHTRPTDMNNPPTASVGLSLSVSLGRLSLKKPPTVLVGFKKRCVPKARSRGRLSLKKPPTALAGFKKRRVPKTRSKSRSKIATPVSPAEAHTVFRTPNTDDRIGGVVPTTAARFGISPSSSPDPDNVNTPFRSV